MGSDKGPGEYVVGLKRWGVVGVMIMVVVIRYVDWRNDWPKLMTGQQIELTDRVTRPVDKFFGKRYLRLGRGGQIQVQVPEKIDINYGDKVKITGTLEARLIDEKIVGFRLIHSDFKVILASKFQITMSKWRNHLIGMVLKWLSGDEGGLAAGILWGGGGTLSENTSENFRKAGLTHIIAASGYNVNVMAGWVMAVAVKIFGRRKSIYFAIVSIILYVLLAGASAAVVRAGIMAGLALLALRLGRRADTVWVWVSTGLVMLSVYPGYIEDVGWQLSMAATAGLVWLGKDPGENLLVANMRTTLAAQGMTVPIILHHFGGVSVIAPVTNLLVLWTVPLVMQIIAAASLGGLIWNGIGMGISWLAWPLLRWMLLVTDVAGRWSFSNWEVGKIGWGWVAGYYLLLIIISNYKFLNSNQHK